VAQLYFENDNDLVLKRFRVSATGEYVSDGVWTADLYHVPGGQAVSGGTGLSFTYTSGSDGEYRCYVGSDVILTLGGRVKVVCRCSNYRRKLVRVLPVVEG